MSNEEPKLVCVTGANGFIAAHTIKLLLSRGYRVRGTVRSTKDPKKNEFLTKMGSSLELVEADLMKKGSFDGAVKGCDFVLHMASPYIVDVKDPQKELVDPAVQGTITVLESCKKNNIKKVVLTSSMAAITDEPIKKYTEADWNTKSSLTRNPYYYSKKLAEEAGHQYASENGIDLVVINPVVVIGPSLNEAVNTSNEIFVNILNGKIPSVMNIAWALVDVRDVALAHVLAMENEKASGRYICFNKTLSMKEICAYFRKDYSEYQAPKMDLTCKLGGKLVRIFAKTQKSGTRDFIETNLNLSLIHI
eukprot:TRINITY_DN4892_c0_g1_i1.p1 TRINITY_DN4892_c0_g1~~TRINITY_DN4892_c0_g1_i1.p1  ORF type:complete len:306 (+),score=54.10 TRINITY_DN4892_c0_g1_i1:64-981(+)